MFFDGKGVRIKESFIKRDGTDGASYWTGFSEEPLGLDKGDKGKFQGTLSPGIVDEYEGKSRVKQAINGLRFEADDDGDF